MTKTTVALVIAGGPAPPITFAIHRQIAKSAKLPAMMMSVRMASSPLVDRDPQTHAMVSAFRRPHCTAKLCSSSVRGDHVIIMEWRSVLR
jgi:hypothetical protein